MRAWPWFLHPLRFESAFLVSLSLLSSSWSRPSTSLQYPLVHYNLSSVPSLWAVFASSPSLSVLEGRQYFLPARQLLSLPLSWGFRRSLSIMNKSSVPFLSFSCHCYLTVTVSSRPRVRASSSHFSISIAQCQGYTLLLHGAWIPLSSLFSEGTLASGSLASTLWLYSAWLWLWVAILQLWQPWTLQFAGHSWWNSISFCNSYTLSLLPTISSMTHSCLRRVMICSCIVLGYSLVSP